MSSLLSYSLVNSSGREVTQIEVAPYMLVLPSGSTKFPKAEDLKENGFVGVAIYAGRYYNDQHRKQEQFVNPAIKKQIEWAKKNELPYAILGYVDAQSTEEAQEEFAKLYLVLMSYPPNLGLWLRINIKNRSALVIDKIILWYQQMLINRGFRYQIGFYNTKDELEKFDWQQFCNNRAGPETEYKDFDRTSVSNYFANDWNLWWLDKPSEEEFENIESVLTPAFFKVIPSGESEANPAVRVTPPMAMGRAAIDTDEKTDTEIITPSGGSATRTQEVE